MICENTISSGFYFMLGKFLFDAALIAAAFFGILIFCGSMAFIYRGKRK